MIARLGVLFEQLEQKEGDGLVIERLVFLEKEVVVDLVELFAHPDFVARLFEHLAVSCLLQGLAFVDATLGKGPNGPVSLGEKANHDAVAGFLEDYAPRRMLLSLSGSPKSPSLAFIRVQNSGPRFVPSRA